MKIGILGCGHIAKKMAKTIQALKWNFESAVASRDINKARKFQKKYKFKNAYGSYQELLSDKDIDVIYIATINSLHYEHIKQCLINNKNVLCEKPLVLHEGEAQKIFERAKKRNLFVIEALWTSFMPYQNTLKRILKELDEPITYAEAVFKVNVMLKERVAKKELGGGVLYDLGIYPLSMIFRTFGYYYQNFNVVKQNFSKGAVDIYDEVDFVYPGFVAKCITSSSVFPHSYFSIQLTNYNILISPIECPKKIEIYDKNKKLLNRYNVKPTFTGFEYELLETERLLKNKQLETALWTNNDTLKTIKVMEEILRQKLD